MKRSKHREAGLKHKLRLRIFRDTLILVFVNENGCLCIYFTELYFFYRFLVASLVILIAVPFVFSRSVNTDSRRYSKCRAYQTLLKITDDIKNNHNKFFIMLKRNSVNVHSNTTTARSAKVRTGWPYTLGDFGDFFNCLVKTPRSIVLNRPCHGFRRDLDE